MKRTTWGTLLGASLVLGTSLVPSSASACGGFFCSQAQGVNQAAERIVFANNKDGTVTAVIEIQYQGPTDKFSWLLPISSVPKGDQIQVAASQSFQRLQQATNPQYSLTTRIEGTCDPSLGLGASGGASSGGFPMSTDAAGASGVDSAVTVEAKGVVGSFEWTVISLDKKLAQPADAAVTWLKQNGYDVPPGAPGLLSPYLADGMYLLALKLVKGATAGSIRPIVLTYDAAKPMIPIKLTSVAANDDMGVMAWVLGDAQAVPQNYYALELNEARINWFNPNLNYNNVVIAAANEAGGQGFVTEYAQPGSSLQGQLWTDQDEIDWQDFKAQAPSADLRTLAVDAMLTFSQWDGFWDVVRAQVALPAGVTLQQVQADPAGHENELVVSPTFVSELDKNVIIPAQVLQQLIDTHPQITRLYSTLSAPEMTVDPLFTFNPGLAPVSNVHTAERVIECAAGYYTSSAPWRIELPQGDVIRGGPSQVGSWPSEFDGQPANRRILRQGETGNGKVLEDNATKIKTSVTAYNQSLPIPLRRASFPIGEPSRPNPSGSAGSAPGDAASPNISPGGGSSGCSLAPSGNPAALLLAALGLAAFVRRRRLR